MFSQHRRRSTGIAADGQGAFPQSESQPLRKAEGRDIYEDIEWIESCRKKSSLVVHPVRKRTRGRSGIFAWQGGGRRRAGARLERQRGPAFPGSMNVSHDLGGCSKRGRPWSEYCSQRYKPFSRVRKDSGSLPSGTHNRGTTTQNRLNAPGGNIESDAPAWSTCR